MSLFSATQYNMHACLAVYAFLIHYAIVLLNQTMNECYGMHTIICIAYIIYSFILY